MSVFIVETVIGGAAYRLPLVRSKGETNTGAVLAIDPGLRLGWALIRPVGKILLAGGFVELNRTRLYASAYDTLKNLLEGLQPVAVAFESYFIGAGAHNKESIEARGAMKAAVERANIAWQELHPSTVRANLGVKGKLKDVQIREIVSTLFGMPVKFQPDPLKKREVFFPADVFDAAAVAWSADKMVGI